MDREKLIRHLEQHYFSKRDMLSRIPLGIQPDALWDELQNRRRSKSTVLPLISHRGTPYWYVTTAKMVSASEKIVDTLHENESDFDPYTNTLPVCTLEEIFYTSYVEGSQITMQAAMEYLTSDLPPRDIEEQLITNNRLAGNFASSNLYRQIDIAFMKELSFILTDGMDNGGHDFREDDLSDFPSSNGESFRFPPPSDIPSRAAEITAFLSDPNTHPLIKAAVAQAWPILVRPFPEGNERLGRMLSNMILLRAGYAFFSEVSLSALIARKSYGYFGAIENILREENAGDLTYFIEYFMELLSRAIDERSLRQRSREEENRQSEIALAHTALTQNPSNLPADVPSPIESPLGPPIPGNELTQAISYHASYKPDMLNENTEQLTADSSDYDAASSQNSSSLERLNQYAESKEKVMGKFSLFLLNLIKEDKDRFNISEVSEQLQLDPRQLSRSIRFLKDDGIIYLEGKRNGQTYYRISVNDISEPEKVKKNIQAAKKQGYGSDVLRLIQELLSSERSVKEWRLGTMLALSLPLKRITLDDYCERGNESKWVSDMILATQLGLVEQKRADQFTILKHLNTDLPILSKKQKEVATEMYECFGNEIFSAEMVVATLDYSDSHATAYLHKFTLLRILDRKKEDGNKYQFLVNPEEHPQLFTNVA